MQNIKNICEQKGIKPTVACVESGAGKNFIHHLEKQRSVPSVEKVQMLAAYLGVSTSDLLGETVQSTEYPLSAEDAQLVEAYWAADSQTRKIVNVALAPYKKRKTTGTGAC